MESRTLYAMFQATVRQHGVRPAVRFKANKATEVTEWTYTALDAK